MVVVLQAWLADLRPVFVLRRFSPPSPPPRSPPPRHPHPHPLSLHLRTPSLALRSTLPLASCKYFDKLRCPVFPRSVNQDNPLPSLRPPPDLPPITLVCSLSRPRCRPTPAKVICSAIPRSMCSYHPIPNLSRLLCPFAWCSGKNRFVILLHTDKLRSILYKNDARVEQAGQRRQYATKLQTVVFDRQPLYIPRLRVQGSRLPLRYPSLGRPRGSTRQVSLRCHQTKRNHIVLHARSTEIYNCIVQTHCMHMLFAYEVITRYVAF